MKWHFFILLISSSCYGLIAHSSYYGETCPSKSPKTGSQLTEEVPFGSSYSVEIDGSIVRCQQKDPELEDIAICSNRLKIGIDSNWSRMKSKIYSINNKKWYELVPDIQNQYPNDGLDFLHGKSLFLKTICDANSWEGYSVKCQRIEKDYVKTVNYEQRLSRIRISTSKCRYLNDDNF